jgi:F-type H+-transporting ATPase subunit epsilon
VFHLQLFSLSGTHFDGEVYEAIVPTTEGDIAINSGHAPLVSVVKSGIISIKRKKTDKSEQHEHLAIFGGAIEVFNNLVRVLVDEAESGDEVVENEAKKAYERAKKLKQDAKDDVSLADAESLIDRHNVRLRLAELKKRSKKRY